MNNLKKVGLPILLTGIWINISITIGWMLILKSYWVEKYQSLNIVYPLGLMNNIVWMIWGFMLATVIFILSKKFTLVQTTFISWFVAFIMLWVIIWNIGVLPTKMLYFNILNTLFITYIGAVICNKLTK